MKTKQNNKAKIEEYHLNRNQPGKPQFAIYDLNEYQLQSHSRNTKPHIHSYYQIIWFKEGKGKHFVDFKSYDVTRNAIFCIAKNQVHYFDGGQNYKGYLIHFNEPFLITGSEELDFFVKCSIFNNPFNAPRYEVPSQYITTLESYISLLKADLQNDDDFGKEELLRSLLKAFLIQLQRGHNESENDRNEVIKSFDPKKVQLVRFVNLLDENYDKGTTVAEYARLMHLSHKSLTDLTNLTLNKTPSQMIQERIILEAQRLLVHSHLNVNQIGYRLGFDDPSCFVKYFKKHGGLSPSEFRKSIT